MVLTNFCFGIKITQLQQSSDFYFLRQQPTSLNFITLAHLISIMSCLRSPCYHTYLYSIYSCASLTISFTATHKFHLSSKPSFLTLFTTCIMFRTCLNIYHSPSILLIIPSFYLSFENISDFLAS